MFGKLTAKIVTNFGFSKGLLGMCPSSNTIEWQSLIGLSTKDAQALTILLTGGQLLKQLLANPSPKTFTAGSTYNPVHRKLLELLGVPDLHAVSILR